MKYYHAVMVVWSDSVCVSIKSLGFESCYSIDLLLSSITTDTLEKSQVRLLMELDALHVNFRPSYQSCFVLHLSSPHSPV